MLKRVTIIVVIAAIVLRLYNAGVFKFDLPTEQEGARFSRDWEGAKCQKIEGVPGSEDFAFLPATPSSPSVLFLSVVPNRRDVRFPDPPPGEVKAFFPSNKTVSSVPFNNLPSGFFFSPHGMSMWIPKDPSASPRLFVVNHHPKDIDTVEIFDVSLSPLSLKYVETIEDETFVSPNDLVATGPRHFFLTNDMGSPRSAEFSRTLESLIPGKIIFSKGSVVHFDGFSGHVVLDHQRMPNGINISPDLKHLYVAETLSNLVNVYTISHEADSQHVRLDLFESIHTGTGVDNIEVDPIDPNILYVGCHPRLLDFVTHAISHTLAPSEVLSIHLSYDSKPSRVEKLALFHGSLISASSVGGVFDGFLIIGPVFDPHILVCDRSVQHQ